MIGHYLLQGHRPVREPDILKWAAWWETAQRRVARERLTLPDGTEAEVSTVFLGIDHGFGGRPLLFETMVFGLKEDAQPCWRYATWLEAEAGHVAVCAALRLGEEPAP